MTPPATAFFLVFLGAGAGGVLRYGVSLAAARWLAPGFPTATLAVNVAGSLAMGLLIGWLAGRMPAHDGLRLLLGTGLLGGFTTFSAFSLEAVELWQRGAMLAAAAYVSASVMLSLGALALGLFLVRSAA
jgi:CrcB protein